jgi:hypothetical protein
VNRWITFGGLGPIISYLLFALMVLAVTVAGRPQETADASVRVWNVVADTGPGKLLFYLPAAALALVAVPLWARSVSAGRRRWLGLAAAAILLGLPQALIGLVVFDQPATAIAAGMSCGAAALAACSTLARSA